jgi:hypothetical protein
MDITDKCDVIYKNNGFLINLGTSIVSMQLVQLFINGINGIIVSAIISMSLYAILTVFHFKYYGKKSKWENKDAKMVES